MMEVTIIYSSLLRQIRGVRQERMSLPDGTTAADLIAILSEKYEDLAPILGVSLLSINREVTFADSEIQNGDEVRIFPAVSGGYE